MRRLAASHFPNEVGTSIVGSYSDDGNHAVLESLAPVTSDSRGARTSFYRGGSGLLEFFRSIFSSSRGRKHYVGEWHSHPGGQPWPSGTDDSNMLGIARDLTAKCPECILVIVAEHKEAAAEFGVFVYSRTRGRVILSRVDGA